ncbi:transposase family protein [Rathayibacter agropyri]|nr:transposase family protein [Rathayibacter agropyri]
MTTQHYAILAERIENEFMWRRGRPRKLSLVGALHVTLLYYRQNITEQLIANVVSIQQSTVSRTIALMGAMLNVVADDEQPHVKAALDETTAVIDGTLLLCWSWADAPELYSPTDKTAGHTRPQGTTPRSSRISPVGRSISRSDRGRAPQCPRLSRNRVSRRPQPLDHAGRQRLPRHRIGHTDEKETRRRTSAGLSERTQSLRQHSPIHDRANNR